MSKQALAYKEQGNAAFKAGDHGKAIECYTYATEIDPTNPVYFQNRAMAYFRMEKYERALRDSNKALGLDPKSVKAHFRKGESLLALKKYQEALKAYQVAADMHPKEDLFITGLAKARGMLMDGKSPVEVFKIQGNESFKKGDIDGALKFYSQAINVGYDGKTEEQKAILADCYANRAACYRQLYRGDECVSDCTNALKLKPNHVKAFIRRGQSYESLERYKHALEDYEAATRLGGGMVATTGASRVRKALKAFANK
jgi:tetratricopeptide (TPR) repeat protein